MRRLLAVFLAATLLAGGPAPLAAGALARLQGRVPGMTVDVGGATIGQGATVRVRGNVSLSQSNQPLIYVDGVRQTANNYPRNVSEGGSTFNAAQVEASPLADIDPDNIERV